MKDTLGKITSAPPPLSVTSPSHTHTILKAYDFVSKTWTPLVQPFASIAKTERFK